MMWNLLFGVVVLQLLFICFKDMYGFIGGQGLYFFFLEKIYLFNLYIKIIKNKIFFIFILYKNFFDLCDKKVVVGL